MPSQPNFPMHTLKVHTLLSTDSPPAPHIPLVILRSPTFQTRPPLASTHSHPPTPRPLHVSVQACTSHLSSTHCTSPPAQTPFTGTDFSLATPMFPHALISCQSHICPSNRLLRNKHLHCTQSRVELQLSGHPQYTHPGSETLSLTTQSTQGAWISLHRKVDPIHTEPDPLLPPPIQSLPTQNLTLSLLQAHRLPIFLQHCSQSLSFHLPPTPSTIPRSKCLSPRQRRLDFVP